ncbi:uncharacterized protein MONBRDRAFT_37601 [Monosiga brevicollis MX1]|uniref:Palmitoyltransferase n=1 Tax=Monosiga brevicollis TaxID=81824 RepID=A9V2R0_MONBE|nr:uncharacterized protein MONBRDRAFT_37601 [Monosiga brevicollis MX1]EDQ88415.1 predicted protein [Monosiga brevicollis MX1]|eukprot:XP_001747008.1 hypothetical protein [Monosiga brevicollis MX1]
MMPCALCICFHAPVSRPPTVEEMTPFQLAQRGILPRLRFHIEDQGFDVNAVDSEGITCLHWAAINDRLPCVNSFPSCPVLLGPTPHKITLRCDRQGHLQTVTVLLKHGADPTFRDVQGFNALHIAAQFGFANLCAYFVAQGTDVDSRDTEGRTALMWAAAKCFAPDLFRLLIGLGAHVNLQDNTSQSTALHYAMATSNTVAVRILIESGADPDIPNVTKMSCRSMLWDRQGPRGKLTQNQNTLRHHLPPVANPRFGWLRRDPVRRYCLLWTPFFGILMVGYAFELLKTNVWLGLLMLAFSVFAWCTSLQTFTLTYLKPGEAPNSLAMWYSTLSVFYGTYFYLFWDMMTNMENLCVVILIPFLFWSFHKTNTTDPGKIVVPASERNRNIIALAENNMLTADHFCMSCVARRPLRSKHCGICNHCVARFDHHCPFVDNDVGAGNHRYFMHYLMCFVASNIMFLVGCMRYFSLECPSHESFFYNLWIKASCSPFIAWLFAQGCLHTTWVSLLLVMHLKQIMFDDFTTNEGVNKFRYDYIRAAKGRSPFHRGLFGNLAEFYFPTVDWTKVFEVDDANRHKIRELRV